MTTEEIIIGCVIGIPVFIGLLLFGAWIAAKYDMRDMD